MYCISFLNNDDFMFSVSTIYTDIVLLSFLSSYCAVYVSAPDRPLILSPALLLPPMQCTHLFRLCMCVHLSMWINGDWRVAESGWCGVINQHNECRWALCRWSPHSGLCHPAGGLFASLQWLCMALTIAIAVFLGQVPLASLFNLWAQFVHDFAL